MGVPKGKSNWENFMKQMKQLENGNGNGSANGKVQRPELAPFPIRKASVQIGLSSFLSYSTNFLNMSSSTPRHTGRTLVESFLSTTPPKPHSFTYPFPRSKSVKELIQQAEAAAAAAAAGCPFPGISEGDRRASPSPFRPLPRRLSQLSRSRLRPTSLSSAADSVASSLDIVRDKPLEPGPRFCSPVSVTNSDESLDSIYTEYSEFLSDIEEETWTTYRTPQTCYSPSCSDRCTPEPYFPSSPTNLAGGATDFNDFPPSSISPFELSEDRSGRYSRSYSPSSSRDLVVTAATNRYRALSPLVETSAEDYLSARNSEAAPILSPTRMVSPSPPPSPACAVSPLPSPARVLSPPASPSLSLAAWVCDASPGEPVPIPARVSESSRFESENPVQDHPELTAVAPEPEVSTYPEPKAPISPRPKLPASPGMSSILAMNLLF